MCKESKWSLERTCIEKVPTYGRNFVNPLKLRKTDVIYLQGVRDRHFFAEIYAAKIFVAQSQIPKLWKGVDRGSLLGLLVWFSFIIAWSYLTH